MKIKSVIMFLLLFVVSGLVFSNGSKEAGPAKVDENGKGVYSQK